MPRKSDARGGRPQGRRRGNTPEFREPARVIVTAVAAQGDGLADLADGRRLFIPFAAPGDEVDVLIGPSRGDGFEARIETFVARGPRAEPFCAHFETCGGCSVQHLSEADYHAWKRGILVQALARRGLHPEVGEIEALPRDGRRRVTFQALGTAKGAILGFAQRRGHHLIDLDACPLVRPELNALLAPLRDVLAGLLESGERARIALARVEGPEGPAIDMVVERDREPDLAAREALADFARDQGLARLSWRDADGHCEPVAHLSPVAATFGPAPVDLPPGGFMQPTAAGEEILRRAVLAGAEGAQRIVELYAGAGTFTMALAKGRHVHAVDADDALTRALAGSAGRAGLGGRISAETRDLAARPLLASELKDADTAVLDPPRAGAKAQVAEIIGAPNIRRVVMVSCNPQTFARDLSLLTDGGFDLVGPVTPVDQFPWSHHLECVAVLTRA